jgi:hypothetical protein
MEYLAAIFGLAVMCGCALGAYGLLDSIEREGEDSTRAAERALRPDGAPARLGRQAVVAGNTKTPRTLTDRDPWSSVLAHAVWLDGRVRDLEDRLDRLVVSSARTTASVLG